MCTWRLMQEERLTGKLGQDMVVEKAHLPRKPRLRAGSGSNGCGLKARARYVLLFPVCFLVLLKPLVLMAATAWSENFDSYLNGELLSGKGGWSLADVGGDAVIVGGGFSPRNRLQLWPTSAVVHLFDITSGLWTLRAKVLIPADHTGATWVNLLNTCDLSAQTFNSSVQVEFAGGRVTSHGGTNFYSRPGTGMPLVPDQWADLRVDIDLTRNTQRIW
jgi:hypothetical protein